jgi:hypothetical protein
MTMRAGSFAKRAERAAKVFVVFVRNMIWFAVLYSVLAWAGVQVAGISLRWALVFGGVFVPAMAALITVLWARGKIRFVNRRGYPYSSDSQRGSSGGASATNVVGGGDGCGGGYDGGGGGGGDCGGGGGF